MCIYYYLRNRFFFLKRKKKKDTNLGWNCPFVLTSGSTFQFPPLLVFIIPGQVGNRYPGSF